MVKPRRKFSFKECQDHPIDQRNVLNTKMCVVGAKNQIFFHPTPPTPTKIIRSLIYPALLHTAFVVSLVHRAGSASHPLNGGRAFSGGHCLDPWRPSYFWAYSVGRLAVALTCPGWALAYILCLLLTAEGGRILPPFTGAPLTRPPESSLGLGWPGGDTGPKIQVQ